MKKKPKPMTSMADVDDMLAAIFASVELAALRFPDSRPLVDGLKTDIRKLYDETFGDKKGPTPQ